MARSILSLGMFSARAARMAARNRAFMPGSGTPSLAATVISRASLENNLERTASWRPLRCMMFLNWECPAMTSFPASSSDKVAARARQGSGQRGAPYRTRERQNPESQTATPARLLDGAQTLALAWLFPERGSGVFELAAKPNGRNPARQSGCIVGLDRQRRQARGTHGGFELGGGNPTDEALQRLVLYHADH